MDWSSAALANQVAYDLALIDLARCLGLDCDPASFDQPQRRRIELEGELISHGIRLDEPEQQAEFRIRTSLGVRSGSGAVNPGRLGRAFLDARREGGGLGAALDPQLGQ